MNAGGQRESRHASDNGLNFESKRRELAIPLSKPTVREILRSG